jgi:hypothetical protein
VKNAQIGGNLTFFEILNWIPIGAAHDPNVNWFENLWDARRMIAVQRKEDNVNILRFGIYVRTRDCAGKDNPGQPK